MYFPLIEQMFVMFFFNKSGGIQPTVCSPQLAHGQRIIQAQVTTRPATHD